MVENSVPSRSPARVSGLPFVGLVPQLLVDPLKTITDAARDRDAATLRIGPMDCALFAHPDHAERILADKAKIYTKESSLWEAAQKFVGKGIGTTDGELWLAHRRAMQPQFQRSRTRDMLTISAEETRAQVEDWRGRVHRPVSLFREVRRMLSRVFFKTMFDASLDAAEMDALLVAVHDSFEAVDKLLWSSFLPKWVPLPGMRRFHEAVAAMDRIVYRLIKDRLRHPSERDDLLNLILKSFDVREDDAEGLRGIRDEVTTMIVATQDGPSLMLGWALALVCRHPEVEQRLRAEIAEVLGDAPVTADNVAGLKYTKAVLEEALRLYPPLWLTVRKATQDDVVDGYRVARGTFVFLSPYHIQRHERFWKDPEKFDPTRFLEGGSAPDHRGAYLPFGLGPHLCLGKHYGLMLGQTFMAEILRRFRVRLAPGASLTPKAMVTIQPKHEVFAEVTAI